MVGLVESVNAWAEDRFSIPRHKSALIVVGSIAGFSIVSLMSYNVIGDVSMGGRNFNDIMDYFSNQVLLPLGGLLIAVFAGWFMTRENSQDELEIANGMGYRLWYFLIRFVVPPAVLIIFVMGVSE